MIQEKRVYHPLFPKRKKPQKKAWRRRRRKERRLGIKDLLKALECEENIVKKKGRDDQAFYKAYGALVFVRDIRRKSSDALIPETERRPADTTKMKRRPMAI